MAASKYKPKRKKRSTKNINGKRQTQSDLTSHARVHEKVRITNCTLTFSVHEHVYLFFKWTIKMK